MYYPPGDTRKAKLDKLSAVSCPLYADKSAMGPVMKDALVDKESLSIVYEDKDGELFALINQELSGTDKFQEPSPESF